MSRFRGVLGPALGDWLVDGKRHYGDGLYKRAAEITGLSSQTLMDFASIAGRFQFSLRNENLAYQHHKEVASVKLIATDDGGYNVPVEQSR